MTHAATISTSNVAAPGDESLKRLPWKYRAVIRKIRELEAHLTALSDRSLRQYIDKIRIAVRDEGAEGLDKHLAGVFAAVSVAARRTVKMRPYHVQLIGGIELHKGRIAEMGTGEGKTLVATLPATLNAVTGRGVHVVTVNDYLAKRDADIMSPIYNLLGFSVGVIISGLNDDQRRAAYRCDIVYGTNKDLGFDYLRDQIKLYDRTRHQKIDTLTLLNRRDSNDPVMRQLNYAIVDEADSILVDEARTPLIIAGPAGLSPLAWAYEWADNLAPRFRARHDFEFEPEKRKLDWKQEGLARLQKILTETNTPSVSAESWQTLVLNAIRARHLYLKEKNYVLTDDRGGEVVIVDEFTGRRMPGRTWAEGLHQAVQAKEKMPVHAPAKTLARTTYQHFFSLYKKLAGMTGTASTERAEFRKVYKLQVVPIPTHRPLRRIRLPDRIYRTAREKWHAVADEIQSISRHGHPVLVGTSSIDDSETLSRVLRAKKIHHDVLNAKPENAAREADIVAHAGELGAITIATNMAGRGTDIKLGPGVATLGGLHVIGTQRHESRRVDNQLVGRCGRQGDPGTAIFMLSLEDPILQHLLSRKALIRLRRSVSVKGNGTAWGQPLRSLRIRQLFATAQRKVEALHYRQRQQLMEYEDWLNKVYYQMGGA
jgi:preprotein translocase subunit SecA